MGIWKERKGKKWECKRNMEGKEEEEDEEDLEAMQSQLATLRS